MAILGQPGVNDNLKYLGDSELLYGDINGILEPPMLAGDDSLAVRGNYSGKRLSEIQTKLCLAWFIARDTVPHTTAHRYITLSMAKGMP